MVIFFLYVFLSVRQKPVLFLLFKQQVTGV